MKARTQIRNLVLFILLPLISSCGLDLGDMLSMSKGTTRKYETTNPVFSSYVSEFESYGKAKLNDPSFAVKNVPINLGDTGNPDHDGVCITYYNGEKEIVIDNSFWEKGSPIQKKILLHHELGHCVLNRKHESSIFRIAGSNFKNSIMHPEIPTSHKYDTFKEGYLKELYTRDETTLILELQKRYKGNITEL